MIDIVIGGSMYAAVLLSCYDGDTCKVRFESIEPKFIAEQRLRFAEFDTPEINGKCEREKKLARRARALTLDYMQNNPTLTTEGKQGKYGRLLVFAPELEKKLLAEGLARPYGSKVSFCET